MRKSRQSTIEELSADGKLEQLKALFESGYTQEEIDEALSNTLAYAMIETAEYLIGLGADLAWEGHHGVYYAAHNNELSALKFAISQGVNINVENGMILNTAIITAINCKDLSMIQWVLSSGADLSFLSDQSRRLIREYGSDGLKQLFSRELKAQWAPRALLIHIYTKCRSLLHYLKILPTLLT